MRSLRKYAGKTIIEHTCVNFQTRYCKRERKTLGRKRKATWAAIFWIHVLNWPGLKWARAVSKITWQVLHKCSQSLHLGDLLSPVKSVVLGFYVGLRNAHVGQIQRPREKILINIWEAQIHLPPPFNRSITWPGLNDVMNCDNNVTSTWCANCPGGFVTWPGEGFLVRLSLLLAAKNMDMMS